MSVPAKDPAEEPQPVPPDKGPKPPVQIPPDQPGLPPDDPDPLPKGDPRPNEPTRLVESLRPSRSLSASAFPLPPLSVFLPFPLPGILTPSPLSVSCAVSRIPLLVWHRVATRLGRTSFLRRDEPARPVNSVREEWSGYGSAS